MPSQSHELSVVSNGTKYIDTDLTYVLFGKRYRIGLWLRVVRWRNWPFYFNDQNIKKPRYKINLHSTVNFEVANPERALGCLFL